MTRSIKGKVGATLVEFKSPPQGTTGVVRVVVGEGAKSQEFEVQYRKDSTGIWIECLNQTFGADFIREPSEDGSVAQAPFYGVERKGHQNWKNLHFRRMGELGELGEATIQKRKGIRVRSQMPGKITRLLVQVGDSVTKDQPLLVMEAMKMENEIRAVQAGKISKVSVVEGQAIETGAELFTLDSE